MPQLPLVWHATLRNPSGYADEARTYLLALDALGWEVSAQELRWTDLDAGLPDAHRRVIDAAVARPRPYPAAHVYHLVPGPQLPYHSDGPVVLRTMFETDRAPEQWLPRLGEADEVWVPCTFNRATFERSGVAAERLHVLPEGIAFDLFTPTGEPRPERAFTFLTNFDFTDRKGWDLLLDAWAAAFDPLDDVRLVLKCLAMHGDTAEIERRIEAHLGGRRTAPIELDKRVLPMAELPGLYEGADAFVLASRGEGWGRPYMEAMAMGLPTIGSRWSGNLDFMHDGNSFLVDGEVVPVAGGAQEHTPIYAGHEWFEPDHDSLVAAMRHVANGGDAVRSRAEGARAELVERFGFPAIGGRLAQLAVDAVARWQERRSRPIRFAWRGDWCSVHSLAVVNEAVTTAAQADGRAAVARTATDGFLIRDEIVGVAQQWPPVFESPTMGPFVLYQPWEFGEIPRAWVEPIRTRVDEVWTPSEYARSAFVDAGVPPELVHVVPNGVDLERFSPDGARHDLGTAKGTVFLFVGGATYRKGIDLLLEAYGEAFTAADDVCLAIKAFGSETLYRGQSAREEIAAFRARPDAPEIVLLDADLPFEDVPPLYRAADCLVQPYRGEGFCLPALEALACGVPVIVTAGGPTDDFAPPEAAWQVAADRKPVGPGMLPGDLAPAGGGWMLEPRRDALVAALRDAARPDARAAKAARARAAAERYGWDRAGRIVLERVAALAGKAPIRQVQPVKVEEHRRVLLAIDADWADEATWAPGVRAYAEAFGEHDDVTLLLPTDDPSIAELVEDVLGGYDDLADIVLAGGTQVDGAALALAVDAFVGTGPTRARLVLDAEPGALKDFLVRSI